MRVRFFLTLVAAMALATAVSSALAQTAVVYVNGRLVHFDQPPIERSSHIFVPLRGVFESLGATVVFRNGEINATGANGTTIHLVVGSPNALVNGKAVSLGYAPFVAAGRALVPLRFIAESLGAVVSYDAATQVVTVNRDGDTGRALAKERAEAAWKALETWFGNSGPSYPNIFAASLRRPKGEVQPGYVWGQGQVVRAALDLAMLTSDYRDFNRTAPTLSRYLLTNLGTTGFAPPVDAGKRSRTATRWWDDNGVTGLVPLQAFIQLGDAHYLQEARNLWPFFLAGQWPGGGQHENEAPYGQLIALGATSFDDQNAERLYLDTSAADPQRAAYLNFALANDAVLKAKLRAPGGLYWSGYNPNIQIGKFKWCDGKLQNGVCSGTWWACNPNRPDLPPPQALPPTPHVCAWMFADNQGTMIASDLLLYRITGNRGYLSSAIRTANAALDYYTPDWLWAQSSWLDADYFVGLFQLDHYAPDPRIRAALKAYLERAWAKGRDPATGLFDRGGIGIYDRTAGFSSLDQSAFVIMYSLLAWPQDKSQDAY